MQRDVLMCSLDTCGLRVGARPIGESFLVEFCVCALTCLSLHFFSYSYGICIATNGLTILMCFMFRQHLAKLNKKAEKEAEGKKGTAYRYLL